MAGRLELVVQFPDRAPVVLSELAGEDGVVGKRRDAR